MLTPSEIQQVVVNWEQLIECNSPFSKYVLYLSLLILPTPPLPLPLPPSPPRALCIRLRTSSAIVQSVGDVLQEHIPNLTPHIRWCSCQLRACTLLQSKSTDPTFREYEQSCLKDPRTKGLPLSSFLLKPMQRVTKYPLLIGKVI